MTTTLKTAQNAEGAEGFDNSFYRLNLAAKCGDNVSENAIFKAFVTRGACNAFCHRVAKRVTMDPYLVTRHNLISSAILFVLNFGNVIMIYVLHGFIIS